MSPAAKGRIGWMQVQRFQYLQGGGTEVLKPEERVIVFEEPKENPRLFVKVVVFEIEE